jgi:hypothetical protein
METFIYNLMGVDIPIIQAKEKDCKGCYFNQVTKYTLCNNLSDGEFMFPCGKNRIWIKQ